MTILKPKEHEKKESKLKEAKEKLAKKMLNGLHEKWTSKKVGGMSYLGK